MKKLIINKQKILCVIILLLVLTIVDIKAENNDIKVPPMPQVVFLKPSGLVDGSSYLPGDFIYITLTGDLSHYETKTETGEEMKKLEYIYRVEYSWNDGNFIPIILSNGVGELSPFQSMANSVYNYDGQYNQWDKLTFNVYLIDYVADTYKLVNTQVFNLYADSSLMPSEPIGIKPITYGNNSIVYPTSGRMHQFNLVFEISGLRFGWDDFDTTSVNLSCLQPAEVQYRWDGDSWNTFFRMPRCPFNIVFFDPVIELYDDTYHDLYFKITNATHSELYHYRYMLMTGEDYDFKLVSDNYYWHTDDIKPFQLATPFNITYNWNDGKDNLTGTSFWRGNVSFPYDYYGYNFTVPRLSVGNQLLSIWLNDSFEYRIAFYFDEIETKINLCYPLNDGIKSGIIPIIWSFKNVAGSYDDFSDYKFDLSYETDVTAKTLIKSDFSVNEIIRSRSQNLQSLEFFTSVFTYYQTELDPFVLGFEFDSSVLFDKVGVAASMQTELVDSLIVNFIIEETVSGVVSDNLNMKISQTMPMFESVTSEGIQIMSAYAAVINITDSTTIETVAPIPFSIFGLMIAVVYLVYRKDH